MHLWRSLYTNSLQAIDNNGHSYDSTDSEKQQGEERQLIVFAVPNLV